MPPLLPRFVVMPDGERFVPLEQVIAAHLPDLFPGMEVEDHVAFRVTRNADLDLEEEEADDLLEAIELEIRRRRFGRAVRLEVEAGGTPSAQAARAALPARPEAARLYMEGLARLRVFDALGARNLLQRAALIEPTHPLIHAALAEAWGALGYEGRRRAEAIVTAIA